MECEICGKPISDDPIRAKIEGSVMAVCSDCAKLGRIQKKPPKPKFQSTKQKKSNKNQTRKQYPKKDEVTDELVEDYAELIRNKRESNNWSREELAAKIFEKTSVISRIESGKMIPDNKLIKKIEKTLNIKLLEKTETIDLNQFKSSSSDGFTLADVVKIKRK